MCPPFLCLLDRSLLAYLEPLVTVLVGSFPVQLAEGTAAHSSTTAEEERMTIAVTNLGVIEVAVQWMILGGPCGAPLLHASLASFVNTLLQQPPFRRSPTNQTLDSPKANEVVTRMMRLLRLLLPALTEGSVTEPTIVDILMLCWNVQVGYALIQCYHN